MSNCGMSEGKKFDGKNTFFGRLHRKLNNARIKRLLRIDQAEVDKNFKKKQK